MIRWRRSFWRMRGRPEDLIADLAQNLRRYRGARIGVYPHERNSCAGLRQTVAEFRAFLTGAPCQELETEEIVAGLEALLAKPARRGRGPGSGLARTHAPLRAGGMQHR